MGLVAVFRRFEEDLNKLLLGLRDEAETRGNDYWDEHRRRNKLVKRNKDRGRIGPRIRMRNGNLTLYWVKQIYTRGDEPKLITEHIKKGKRYAFRYPMSVFTRIARDWELEIIEEVEEDFASYRRRAKRITEARLALRKVAEEHGYRPEDIASVPSDSDDHADAD